MLEEFVRLIQEFHARGWTPGTGGNFSYVSSGDPLRLCITPSGAEKGSISANDLLIVDERGDVQGEGKASAETLLHVAIVKSFDAKVVFHTHTVWNTLASMNELHPLTFRNTDGSPAFWIQGLEMLKALGRTTHETVEAVPILPNSQDIPMLAGLIRMTARDFPRTKGILLSGHGLYTWGKDLAEAQRHLEALEFLFEVTLRSEAMKRGGH